MTKNFICSAPWQGMFINPDGDFRVCCAGQSLGNLNKKSLLEIINDVPIQNVRNDILTKGYSEYCKNCMDIEKIQGHSLRSQFLQDLKKFDTTTYNPTVTDIRWKNTCQLRCVYCNSEWSSTYAKWEGRTLPVSSVDWQQDVLDFLSTHKRHYVTVNLLGGEPLLLKDNLQFLQMVDSDTRISLVTNLAVDGVEKLPVYKELINRSCSWLISLEATGRQYEWIRRESSWQVTKQNYENLKLNNTSTKGVHMTYCIYSAFCLTDTFNWLREVEPNKNLNFSHISVLMGPDMFDIHNFTPEIKILAIEEIDNCLDKHKDYLTDGQATSLLNIKQSLLNQLYSVNMQSIMLFKQHIEKSDSEMDDKFSDYWPKLSILLNNLDI
jgi:hypothetical protein